MAVSQAVLVIIVIGMYRAIFNILQKDMCGLINRATLIIDMLIQVQVYFINNVNNCRNLFSQMEHDRDNKVSYIVPQGTAKTL